MKKIYLFVIFCLTFSVLSFGQKYYSASDEKYYELSKDAVGLKSAALSVSDTVIAGDHVSDYSSDYTRGYYFQAQSSFVIRELMCAEEANPGAARQSVEVILFGAEPPVAYPGPGGEHTTLFSAIDVSSGWIECGVDVVEGSYYGIIGAKHDQGGSTMYNSYGDSQDLMIDGISTSCNRLILQQSLATGSPLSGSYMSDPGSIGRIHFIVGRYWEDIVVDNDPGICGAVVNYTVPTVEGAIVTQIDASGLTSGDEFPVGVTMQEFLIDYGEGVTETRSFTVTVNDTEPPVLDCPENIVVSNDSGECGAVVTFNALTDEVLLDEVLAGSLAGWGITDEQYNPILSFEEIVSPFDGTSAIQTSVVGNTIMMCETKAVTKTYDIIGNSATVDLKVYLEFASNLTTYNFPYIVAELLDENDNSLGQHVYYGKDMVGSFFLNSHILTNPDSYTELPSATGDMVLDLARIGEDIDFNKISIKLCNYACEGENSIVFDHLRAINSGLGGGTGESGSVASDNCPGVQVEASIPSGSFFQVGTTPVTLTATDAAGNITSCSFNVTVNDTEAPVAICKEGATGVAAYVSSTAGEPWGQPTGKEAMDLAFGSGNWEQLYFETADLAVLLSDAYSFIYIEGGDGNANSMEAFIDAHITEMENWVANGGNLFLNAAPNVGDGMSWGFWGVELYYPDASNSVEATDPSHPIFNGPFTPVIAGPYTGGSYAHATIPEALNVTVLLQNTEDPTKHVLSYAEWGLGRVLFGGMTATYFHSPQPEALNLRANMFDFLSKRVSEFELDENGEVVITPEDIDGGSTDNCGIENMEVNPSEFGIEDLGEQEVTLTVTDAAGNTSSCTATVIIVANSDGPVVVANPIDVYLDETGGYTLAPEDLEMMADGTT
ncbi:HYR domain-containing protein, partial [Mariniphaga anaerophila]